jgi:Tol biopolymer transport system component
MIRRTMIFGAAALAVAGSAPGLSQATAPGKNGRIAFQRFELHDAPLTAHIVVANSDGSGQQTITHGSRKYVDDQPDWAPNGARIVFQRCGGKSPCSIWSVRPDGRNPRQLSPRCRSGAKKCPEYQSPVYSPDGRHIAFTRERGASLVVMIADATLRHAHRVGSGYEPAWSPDGKHLAFVWKPRGKPQAVFVSKADGTGRRRITAWKLRAGDHPDWSPDGTRILFASGPETDHGNLFTILSDGKGLRQLTRYHGLTKVEVGSYSPDGQSILFATAVGAVNPPGASLPYVFVMTADGTDIRPVTRARNWDGSPDWGPRR